MESSRLTAAAAQLKARAAAEVRYGSMSELSAVQGRLLPKEVTGYLVAAEAVAGLPSTIRASRDLISRSSQPSEESVETGDPMAARERSICKDRQERQGN